MSIRNVSAAALFLAFSFGTSVASAADEKPADPKVAPKVTYDEHIQPIFRAACFTCHNQNEAKSDLALDTYARTMTGGAGGECVIPGDLESSRLYALVAHLETPKMPPNQDKIAECATEFDQAMDRRRRAGKLRLEGED